MALKFSFNKQSYSVGDTIKVNYKIKEKDKERLQAFDGIVIAIKGSQDTGTFTVQKQASNKVVVERIFPIKSPWIADIKKLRGPKRRIARAKLYFLRDPKARKI